MRINYNVTGPKRKEMVTVVSKTVRIEPVYMKVPTCNYAVGNIIITKDGGLEWNEKTRQETIDKVTAALAEAGFEAEMPETEGSEPDEDPEETPAEPETSESETSEPEEFEESTGTDEDADTDDESAGLTIEVPFDKVSVGNLTNILESKGTLIKKALGIDDLRIEMKEDRVAFPWFDEVPEPEETQVYTEFISLLCKLSKELKRASSKETPVTNEKYTFRCFLLRLGMIGNEYKQTRKILLKNLSGNSSWKNGAPETEVQA